MVEIDSTHHERPEWRDAGPKSLWRGWSPMRRKKNADPEALIAGSHGQVWRGYCLSSPGVDDGHHGLYSRWATNGEMARVVEAHPDRFVYQPNVSPIKHKGVKNTIWELEYWVKEKGAKIFKFYPPEDTYINDPEIWPFYKKAEELDIVLDIHTGFGWCAPGKEQRDCPCILDDVARDFP